MQWFKPWIHVDNERDQQAWQRELRRECASGHPLFGVDVEFIARRRDRDDFLVLLDDRRVATVHLTWSVESNPNWPGVVIFRDLDQWTNEVMLPDHAEWQD